MRIVAVENGEGQIVDVGRDAGAEDRHEERGAEKRETHADRIAEQFQRFANRIGEETAQAEPGGRSVGA